MALPIPQIVKDHPFITVGGIVGVIVLVLLVSGGGGASASDSGGGYAATSSDADALSQLQAQLNASVANTQAQKEVALNQSAAQITLAQIGADAAKYAADKNYTLESEKINSAERQTVQISTLQANLQQAGIQAQQAINDRTLLSQEKQAQTLANTNIQLATIAAKPKGLFSFIFG